MVNLDSKDKSIEEMKKRVLMLSWDLSIISNAELRKNKELELEMLKSNLKLLSSGGEMNGKERKEKEEEIIV